MGIGHGRKRDFEDRESYGFSGPSDRAPVRRVYGLQPWTGAGGHPSGSLPPYVQRRRRAVHRVVMKDGSLTPAFVFGGENEQRKRLESEGVTFKGDKVDMAEHLVQINRCFR